MADLRATEHPFEGRMADTPDADPTEDLTEDEKAELCRLRETMGFIPIGASQPQLIAGRYEVRKKLGEGGMGKVYQVYDRECDDDKVALKLVRHRHVRDVVRLQRMLLGEAKAMAKLRGHRNVVGLYDVGAHQENNYFTMEYVDGLDLRSWCEAYRPSHEQILRLYLAAGRGLKAAHDIGLVHRDFKPDNVLVTREGIAKVADFGIAEITLALASDEASAVSEPVDMRGGTRAYMAPEQLRHDRVDKRADQFSFCVSVWESFCGQQPYTWTSEPEQVLALAGTPRGGESMPRWLRRALQRGMAAQRTDRYPDIADLLVRLEQGLARPQRRKRVALMGLGAIGAAAAAALATVALWPEPPPPETCEEFVAAVDRYWGPPQRSALQARRAEAPESVDDAIVRLDRFRDDWIAAASDACRGAAAPEPETHARHCFERWLEPFDEAVEYLTKYGDFQTLVSAPELLNSLVPPGGDYCALSGQHIEDPSLYTLVIDARAASVVGDRARATKLAVDAFARAEMLAGEREYTPGRAIAHAARAEVLHRQGEFEQAIVDYRAAEAQSLGAADPQTLAWVWILWGKGLAMTGDEDRVREALIQLGRAKPLLAAGNMPANSPMQGEHIEATALALERLGRFDEAAEQYRRSAAFFTELGLPIQAARSTYNLGALELTRGELEAAEVATRSALAMLERENFPSSYPYLLEVEFNLGNLLLERFYVSEDEELGRQRGREGLEFLQRVIDHGPARERVQALGVAVQLAADLELPDRARAYADATIAGLDTAELSPGEASRVRVQVGLALLIALRDPRGEPMVRTLLARRHFLDVDLYWALLRSWIEFLERERRCTEAFTELEVLDDVEGLTAIEEYHSWRRERPDGGCP
jgi:tRNA A-37 threonylcarbamoyl transferase component Bud32/tetratricopeptide (TPR) repeat protein